MNTIIWNLLIKLVNADWIGGWVRGGVAAVIGIIVANVPWMASIITWAACPSTTSIQVPCDIGTAQGIIGASVATIIVGIWQQLAKSMTAPTPTQIVNVIKDAASAGLIPHDVATAVKADPTIAMPDVAKGNLG